MANYMVEKFSKPEFDNPENYNNNKNQNPISRRNFLKMAGTAGVATALFGIARPAKAMSRLYEDNREKKSATSIEWYENDLMEKNKWIKSEVISFLDQEEVEKTLGFNPVNSEIKSNLRIEEASIANNNGYTKDTSIFINGFLFSEGDPKKYLLNHCFTEKDLEKPHFKKAFKFYNKIIGDKEVLKLYRNLLIVHEYSHVGEFYGQGEAGHEMATRKEIQLLKRLLQSKKINKELFEKMFSIYTDYYGKNKSK